MYDQLWNVLHFYIPDGSMFSKCNSPGRPPRLSHSSWTMNIHVPGHDPLIFSFLSFILFHWVGVLWPQLSKVLKPVCWDGSVIFTAHHLAHRTEHSSEHSASSTATWSNEYGVIASFPYLQPKLHVQHAATATFGGHQLQGAVKRRQHERLRELPESHCNRSKRAATV